MKKLIFLTSFIFIIQSSFALRFYNPEYGRWLNQDPIGVKGGINVYNSVSNNMVNAYNGGIAWPAGMQFQINEDVHEIVGLDADGRKLFIKSKSSKVENDRLYKALEILNKNIEAKQVRNTSWYCIELKDNAQSNTLSGRLVQSIIESDKRVKIVPDGKRPSFRRAELLVSFPKYTVKKAFKSKTFPAFATIPLVYIGSLGSTNKEQALILSHELIHAYYFINGQRKANEIENQFYWIDKNSKKFKTPTIARFKFINKQNRVIKTREEEFYTIGTSVVTKVSRNKTLEVTYFDALYTENKIARELKIGSYRLAHIGYHDKLKYAENPIPEGWRAVYLKVRR